MNDSKFNMWRACIALIHLDDQVSPEEREYALDRIKNLKLSDEQRAQLLADLDSGVNFDSCAQKITEKKDLAFLIHLVRTVGHMDGEFSDVEQEKFKKVQEKVLSGIDLGALEQRVKSEEIQSYHESEVYKVHNRGSIFERVHRGIQKFINPGDYKMPK